MLRQAAFRRAGEGEGAEQRRLTPLSSSLVDTVHCVLSASVRGSATQVRVRVLGAWMFFTAVLSAAGTAVSFGGFSLPTVTTIWGFVTIFNLVIYYTYVRQAWLCRVHVRSAALPQEDWMCHQGDPAPAPAPQPPAPSPRPFSCSHVL